MGDLFSCCKPQLQILQLNKLQLLDPSLLFQIEQLRKENEQDIAKSQTIVYANGSMFKGLLDNKNKRRGYGQFRSAGHVYLGQFENDLPHGHGIIIKNDQEYFVGNFQKGKLSGSGRQYSFNHNFEGQYENNYRRKGVLKTQNLEYQGSFLQNKFHGEGRILFADGTSYEGSFFQGKYQGKGLLNFPDMNVYEGNFSRGLYHGEGRYTWEDGTIFEGYYNMGVRTQKGVYTKDKKQFGRDLSESIKMSQEGNNSGITQPKIENRNDLNFKKKW